MSRTSRILIADADSKDAGLLSFGFEREGLPVALVSSVDEAAARLGDADVLVAAVSDEGGGIPADLIRRVRAASSANPRLPVLALGEERLRSAATGAGASDFLPRPVYVRDVVTLARLATMGRGNHPTVWAGELREFAGIFFLMRALVRARRTGVLTVVRGLRRGELRFYEGEVTSAQTGALHGHAALHQMMLWNAAKMEFRSEAVVRRQQIPLSPDELLEDCGRFLRDFHEVAQELKPGQVYEQDMRRVTEVMDKIPKEVGPVLRLFDGQRTLADVVEDSPFRVFETVKIANRLAKLGAVHEPDPTRPRDAAAALAVGDWLQPKTPPLGVPALSTREDSEPVGPKPGEPASPPPEAEKKENGSRRKKRRSGPRGVAGPADAGASAAAAAGVGAGAGAGAGAGTGAGAGAGAGASAGAGVAARGDDAIPQVDWGKLPSTAGSVWDLPGYAPVVPSQVATGEIQSVRPAPASDLAQVGKVIADDLAPAAAEAAAQASAAQATAATQAQPATASPAVKATGTAPPAVLGHARERVEEISARHERSEAPAPAAEKPVEKPAEKPVEKPPSDSGIVTGALEVAPPPPEPQQEDSGAKTILIDVGFEEESQPSKPALPAALSSEAAQHEAEANAAAFAQAAAREEEERARAAHEAEVEAAAKAAALQAAREAEAKAAAAERAAREAEARAAAAERAAADAAERAAAEIAEVQKAQASVAAAAAVAAATARMAKLEPEAAEIVIEAGEPEPPGAAATPEASGVPAAPVQPATEASGPTTRPRPRRPTNPVEVAADAAAAATRGASDAAAAAARALDFDELEHAFFDQGNKLAEAKPPPVESFDDLDHGMPARPPEGGFWRRFLGLRPSQPATPQRRPAPSGGGGGGGGGGQGQKPRSQRPTGSPPTGGKGGGGGGKGGGGGGGKGGGGKRR